MEQGRGRGRGGGRGRGRGKPTNRSEDASSALGSWGKGKDESESASRPQRSVVQPDLPAAPSAATPETPASTASSQNSNRNRNRNRPRKPRAEHSTPSGTGDVDANVAAAGEQLNKLTLDWQAGDSAPKSSQPAYKPRQRSRGGRGGGRGGSGPLPNASGGGPAKYLQPTGPPPVLAKWIETRMRVLSAIARQRVLVRNRLVRISQRTMRIGEVTFEITDGKPNTHGPDDPLYERSFAKPAPAHNTWEGQPRGQTEVRVGKDLVCLLVGLRKFGYEEDPYMSHSAPEEQIVCETYSRKENGECFHLTAFKWKNQFYYVGGSKNVHGVVRADPKFIERDINSYTEPRYEFFRELMLLWNKTQNRISRVQRKTLLTYLSTTQTTLAGESCTHEHQHLVDYESDRMFFFAMNTPQHSSQGLTSLLPEESRYLFEKIWGIGGVSVQITVSIDEDRYIQVRNQFRLEPNSEGAVVYVISKNTVTGRSRVSRIYKYKNEDYVFRRAVREQMRSRASSSKIKARIRKLHFRHTKHEEMTAQGLQFNAWCRMRETRGDFKWDWLFSHWITLEKEFAKVPVQERRRILEKFDKDDLGVGGLSGASLVQTSQLHIFAVGPPGTGKSTVWRVLERMYDGFKRVNQDDFGGKAGPYHAAITKLAESKNVKAILLDKCNHNSFIRGNAYNALGTLGKRVFVMFVHPDDKPESGILTKTVALSHNRIYGRGLAHSTLFPDQRLAGILSGFAESWEDLTDAEKQSAALVIRVDITMPLEGVIQSIVDELREEKLLPPAIDDDAKLHACIDAVLEQERALAAKNSAGKPILYFALRLTEQSNHDARCHPVVVEVLDKEPQLALSNELHCTVLFVGGKPLSELSRSQSEIAQFYSPREGQKIDFVTKSICHDHNGACLVLSLPATAPCDNVIPHITLALVPGIKPVYSNDMLSRATSAFVPCKMQLTGIVTKVLAV